MHLVGPEDLLSISIQYHEVVCLSAGALLRQMPQYLDICSASWLSVRGDQMIMRETPDQKTLQAFRVCSKVTSVEKTLTVVDPVKICKAVPLDVVNT